MRKLIGTWNTTRGLWETGTLDLLSEHSEPFSETWPTWGMTRSGVAFELPTRAPLMDASASSSSPVLATPRTSDTNGPGHHGDGGMDLRTQVSLLPTPMVGSTSPAAHGQISGQFREAMAKAIDRMRTPLLPTPKAGDGEFVSGSTSGRPVEKSTHLGTIALLQAGHLEHRRTGADTNPRSEGGSA